MPRNKSPGNKPLITIHPHDFNVTATRNEDWVPAKTAIETFPLTLAQLRKYRSTGAVPWLTVGKKIFYYRPAVNQL